MQVKLLSVVALLSLVGCADDDDPNAPVPVFESPIPGATGGAIAVTGDTLYWELSIGGQSAIATGPTSGGTATVLVPPGPAITVSDTQGAFIYQTGEGLFYASGGAVHALPDAPPCAAVGGGEGIYCRTLDTRELLNWRGVVGPTTLLTNLQPGDSMSYGTVAFESGLFLSVVDTPNTFTGGVQIVRRGPTGDLGIGNVVGGAMNPTSVTVGGSNHPAARTEIVAWLEHRPEGVSTHALVGGQSKLLADTPDAFMVVARAQENADVWVASPTTIWQITPWGTVQWTLTASDGVGGIAIEPAKPEQFPTLFYTTSTGAVYRRTASPQ